MLIPTAHPCMQQTFKTSCVAVIKLCAFVFQSLKTASSVLMDVTTGEFLEFGFAAESRYESAKEKRKTKSNRCNLTLFRHFKMVLHKREVDSTVRPVVT